uniref:Sulfate_transp domain-containing protein n=1 Tax=Caenorhabditis tropicalis TaxID=1561998 RepID=A0A1I7UXI1_9PELO
MREVYQSCTTTDEEIIQSKKSSSPFRKKIQQYIPILEWLPNYKWKEHLHGDIIAGLTVGIMHVPQGMAYASLAGVPPVYGMYSSFFASTIYMFFGTARHISIGVFAVASMMVGASRLRLAPDVVVPIGNSSTVEPPIYPLGEYVDPLSRARYCSVAMTFLGCCSTANDFCQHLSSGTTLNAMLSYTPQSIILIFHDFSRK